MNPSRKKGFALIVTLFIVALLLVVVIAFLSKAGLQRKISFSDAGMVRAELLAKASVDVIRGDLLDEMQAGSTTTTYGTYRCFVPTSPAVSVPYVNVSGTATGSLIKMSARGVPFWSGAAYSVPGPDRASTVGSDTASLNGRSISTSRWNKPLLTGSITAWPYAPNGTTPLAAPDWIYVNRQGAVDTTSNLVGTSPAWSDPTPANGQRIIGRYAYTIYDVGGLLDINVAGSQRADVSAAQQSYKQSLASADLSLLLNSGTITNAADNFVSWRKGSVTSPTYSQYLSVLTSNTGAPWNYKWGYGMAGGFMRVYPGYQAFANRQDLINYSNNNPGIIPPAQLPNLTMFTRAVDAPSYMPTSFSYTNTQTGSAGTYPTTASSSTNSNPNLPTIRTSTNLPLFNQRFPLSQIALLSPFGTANRAANTSAVLKAFGLSDFDGYSWIYSHSLLGTNPDGTSYRYFNTPAQIAALGRTPDFFETLAAGIENDSLGSASNNYGVTLTATIQVNAWNSRTFSVNYDKDKFLQVMQIGANIINQYMATDWPVCIKFQNELKIQQMNGYSTKEIVSEVNGVANIPYFNTLYYKPYRKPASLGNINQDTVDCYYLFEVWNPHKNATTLYGSSSGPQQFRIRSVNGASLITRGAGRTYDIIAGVGYPHYTGESPPNNNFVGNIISFKNSATFAEPTVLSFTNTTNNSDPNGVVKLSASQSFSGFWINSYFFPDERFDSASTDAQSHDNGVVILNPSGVPDGTENVDGNNTADPAVAEPKGSFFSSEPVFHYEYLDKAAGTPQWHLLYSSHELNNAVPGQNQDESWSGGSNDGPAYTNFYYGDAEFTGSRLDPRSHRFGMVEKLGNYTGTTPPRLFKFTPGATAAPDRVATTNHAPDFYIGLTLPWGVGYTQGNSLIDSNDYPCDSRSLSDNATSPNNLYYQNQDGVQRRADGDYANGITPTAPGATLGRPIILNRPFYNVGELGYADRDEPWKTLDFWSANSADAGLLDLFCTDAIDTTSSGRLTTKEGLPVVAGRLNPNTKNASALAAMLSGSRVDELTAGSTLTQAEATAIANAWVAWNSAAGTNPAVNRGDYVSFLASSQLSAALTAIGASTGLQFVKTQKESISRALANVSNTRTWNLMIDVVAQSGRVATGATNLSNFQVEGERRYWVHLAIDRVSGEVVDQIWEPVNE